MLRLDDYVLNSFLGKGTFGEVYLTQKEGNKERYYATKRMNKQMVDDPRYKKYFNNEIKILKSLFHENIIRLQDLKVTTNHYYIIMEYCNGGSLTQCLKRYKEMYHRPFTEAIVQHIMRQIMSAVKYMHSQGIIHRDLKLDNILVNFFKQEDYNILDLLKAQVKIIDFGFASSKEDNPMYTTAVGSPLNMDPLILKKFYAGKAQTNDLCYDEKADIWSLGALCYQMLIGNSPFDAYNMQELVQKIEEGTYKVPTNLSREVVSFLNGMLQYDPHKRLNAESLYKHAFLTKNVSEFTSMNTNIISRKVYGGQLNINIKDNQSIWAIFNEEAQKTFDNIPNFMSGDMPLSESQYFETTDNIPGISPKPYDEEQNFIKNNFASTDSVPVVTDNIGQKNNSSISTGISGGLNMPPVSQKNLSQEQFQYPPPQQNQYYQMPANNINQQPNINKNNNKLTQTHIITFRNDIFLQQNNQNNNGIYQNQQQIPQNYAYKKGSSSNNIRNDYQVMQSPTIKNAQANQYNRMLTPPAIQYAGNLNVINRGNNVVGPQYPPQNIAMMQQMQRNQQPPYVNNPQVQQQYAPPNPQVQNQLIQNQPNNYVDNKKIKINQRVVQPGQLKITQRQPNLSPVQKTQKNYSKQTAKLNGPNLNQNQIRKINIINPPNQPGTPTRGPYNQMRIFGQKDKINKVVMPVMQRVKPQTIQKVPSETNILVNKNLVNKNFAQISNQKYVQPPNSDMKKNQLVPIYQNRNIVKKIQFNTPQKKIIAPNGNYINSPHFVYNKGNVS